MPQITEVEKAYIAGLFDGEGTIGYYFKGKLRTHVAQLAIYNTDPRVMVWLRNILPSGGVYPNSRIKTGRKRGWQWMLSSRPCVEQFIRAIRPYLVIKADQVDLILALWEAEDKLKRGRRISDNVKQLRQDAELQLKMLKTAQYSLPAH